MFVVAGVTGNTGSVVANTLLEQGKPVRVIVRSEDKGASWKSRGADVAVASFDDAASIASALRGAQAAYLLLPPPSGGSGILADRKRCAETLAQAVTDSAVPNIVFLSSIGAQHPDGTGIIATLNEGERALGATSANLTFLRAAYFMENWGMGLQSAIKDGVLPSFIPESQKIPMVSVRDIGRTAAKYLADSSTGRRVVELAGPEEYSPADVAAALGRLLNKQVNVAFAPDSAIIPALTSMGVPQELAELFHGMYVGIANGRVSWDAQGATPVRGDTTIEQALSAMLAQGGGPRT
jgi:uncharacterized protein YbjT (DUF2867 family)